jgi:UTP--glucose-1-phosphate uridylyltransferase
MDHVISESGEPKYLIIPAAGLGTRMKSVNPDLPKELLPVGHKPAIQYAVEEGLFAGIKNVIIIINKQKEIIRQYFEEEKVSRSLFPGAADEMQEIRKNVSCHFLYQGEPLGESDAIGYASDVTGSHSVAIIHPDDIYFPAPGVLSALKAVYNQHKADVIALVEIKEENFAGLSNSGRVDISYANNNVYRIEKFIQKSGGPFIQRFKGELRACGMSISGPHIFEYIEELRTDITEVEFTDFPVHTMTLQEKGFIGCHLKGTFFDIGNPKGYELCLKYIQKRNAKSV